MDWPPLRRILARGSLRRSRVWRGVAAAVAAITAVIAITVVVSRHTTPGFAPPSTQESGLRRGASVQEPTSPPGGVLTGSIREGDQLAAITLLTQATLVRVNRTTDQVEPWLAESWTVSPDNLTYTMKLRPGILQRDGKPFVARELVSPLRAGDSPLLVMGKPLVVRASGPLDVQITFPGAFAPALRWLARVPIELGPFVLMPGLSGKELRFERNPHYWRNAPDGRPLPYLDALVLKIIPDQNAELQQLLDGQLDFIQSEIRPEDYGPLVRADQSNKIRVYDLGPGLDADALWLNLSKPLLAKDDFRLAISVAVDRRKLCDAVYLGACDPVWGPVTPGDPAWFDPGLPAAGPDKTLARAMLAGLGLHYRNADGILEDEEGQPARFTMLVRRESTRDGLGSRFVRDELRRVGIDVAIVTVEPDALQTRRLKGDYDAIYGRLMGTDTDPAMNLDFWLQWESTAWGKQIAALMRKQASTFDRVQRKQLFADAQKIYTEHMPAIVFIAPYDYVATSMRVLNAKPSRQRPALLWNAELLAASR
jgi:peptide/nickel transport system substrate-binding protein